MNPGLVSSFAKMCIKNIVENDKSLYVRTHKKQLLNLLNNNQYGLVAKKLKVTHIQEVDVDDQKTNIPYEENVLYSTWNCYAYICEAVSSPEIAFGNKKEFYSYKSVFDVDINDLFLSLPLPAFNYEEKTISPKGKVIGHISTHEEIFMIRNLFTYKNYMPTVSFVYSPCEYAIKSIKQFELKPATNFHLITKDEIIDGGESVGIIIQGKRFKTRYFGNQLNTNQIDESATILQVAASSYSAFIYILNHSNQGLLFPEDLNENEVLNVAKKYLKKYDSFECDKIKIKLGK